jgi:hypothetical protein
MLLLLLLQPGKEGLLLLQLPVLLLQLMLKFSHSLQPQGSCVVDSLIIVICRAPPMHPAADLTPQLVGHLFGSRLQDSHPSRAHQGPQEGGGGGPSQHVPGGSSGCLPITACRSQECMQQHGSCQHVARPGPQRGLQRAEQRHKGASHICDLPCCISRRPGSGLLCVLADWLCCFLLLEPAFACLTGPAVCLSKHAAGTALHLQQTGGNSGSSQARKSKQEAASGSRRRRHFS